MDSLVSVAVADLNMEDVEQTSMERAPQDMKPKIWKRYMDDHLNSSKKGPERQIHRPPEQH